MDRLSNQSIDQQASQFLGTLIAGGFVDTAFEPFDERQNYIRYFEWFLCLARAKRVWQDPAQFRLATAAQSQRWQESHLSARTHPAPFFLNHWAVELARFAVPTGHIGFVRYIEQVVNDVDGGYYATNVSYWGSPRFVDPDVDNLRWYLTLSYFDGTLPARYEIVSATPIPVHALPGQPYSELPEIDALWYPAHHRRPLKLLVPGQRVLRFFAISPPTITYQWQISGKLSGITQSTYQESAIKNAREIF